MYRATTPSIGLAAGLALWAAGCTGMDFGGEIRVPGSQTHVLAEGESHPSPILLPGERLFNIHQTAGSRTPGPEGTAREDAAATNDGSAFCLAEATNGGSANAEFKIGHRIENRTGQALTAEIQVEFDLDYTVTASAEPAAQTLATANLHLAVLDARNRPVASSAIVQLTSDMASTQASMSHRHRLHAVIEPPQRCANVLLYGKVIGTAAAEQQASARVEIKNLRVRIDCSPVPPASAPAAQP